jgi:hypothetical protein
MIRGKTREEKSGAIRRGSGILNMLTFGLLGKDESSHVIVKCGERDLAPGREQKGRESVSGRRLGLSREQSPPADERLLPTITSHGGYPRGVKVYPHQRKRENLTSKANAVSISRSILRTAKVIRQPGDGSCLFHSMSYGIGTNATVLRGEICDFIGIIKTSKSVTQH